MVVGAASIMTSARAENAGATSNRDVLAGLLCQVLDAQYEAVENYCNAQTALFNAIHSRETPQHPSVGRQLQADSPDHRVASSVDGAVRSHGDAVSALHRNLRDLHELHPQLPRNVRRVVSEHIDRMEHILAWLGGHEPLVHPNGVPCRAEISTDAFTLALTSTRASLRLVKDAVPKS
jgi:hypothetical protein